MGVMLAMMQNNKNSVSSELESVRFLLRRWRRWKRNWRPNLGAPSAVPYLDQIHGTIDSYAEADDYDDRIDGWVVQAIESAIDKDLTREEAHAINVFYLNELGAAVFRSRRFTREDIRRLCDSAEAKLIPALKRRHILL